MDEQEFLKFVSATQQPHREKHVHRDVITAWAYGAPVQIYMNGGWYDISEPHWHATARYRVRPVEDTKEVDHSVQAAEARCLANFTEMTYQYIDSIK